MHHIQSVSVEGFWDTHKLGFELKPHVTFFIGQNGTGKTTLINLVAAALTSDFRTLDRIAFKKITITLTPGEGLKEQPQIIVTKVSRKDRPFEFVEYRIKTGKPGPEIKFALDEAEEELFARRRYAAEHFEMIRRRSFTGIASALSELVSVNWLSVNRTSLADRPPSERPASFESSLDLKLKALSDEIVRYFSTLSKMKDDEIRQFQESMIISLVEAHEGLDFLDVRRLDKLDEYEVALKTIFNELGVSQTKSESLTADYMRRGRALKQATRGRNDEPRSIEDLMVLVNLRRIEEVVKRWHLLQGRLSKIFAPRERYLKIARDLFQRKTMEITASNELHFTSRTGKSLPYQVLSSGEKQLLILLSETLLQRERPAIFIADEPELSLHVLWQEKLVASLRTLNPNAQIIAATHSPDIVGNMSRHAINMESLIP